MFRCGFDFCPHLIYTSFKYFHFFLKNTKPKRKRRESTASCSSTDCSLKVPPVPEDLEPFRLNLLRRATALYEHLIPANTKIRVQIKGGAKKSFEVTCPVAGCNDTIRPYFGWQIRRYVCNPFNIDRHIKRKHKI